MKQKIILQLLPVLCLLLQLSIQAQVTLPINLHVAPAGTLPDMIAPNEKYLITNLTLTGELNGTDILYIREMAGRDVNGNQTDGKLSVLDLSGADILSGGASYYIYNSNYPFYTQNDSLGINTFFNCNQLTSVKIPTSVIFIGGNAFWGCTNLASVIIPDSLKSIGIAAFSGCNGLASMKIPKSVTSIDEYVFNECTGLTTISIPNSVTSIGTNAFRSCVGLTSVSLSDSLISIGVAAFGDCTGLTSITIPNSVISIGMGAFAGCNGLTSVSIGNNIESIGYEAFYNCTGLTSVTIPFSVNSIGEYAFSGCNSLSKIHSNNPVPPSLGAGAFQGVNKTTCSLYVPKGSSDSYRSANYWSEFFKIVEENVSVSTNDLSYRKITVYASHNELNIETTEAIPVSIWLVSGKKVFEGVVGNKTAIPLNDGVYFVRTASESRKVIVY